MIKNNIRALIIIIVNAAFLVYQEKSLTTVEVRLKQPFSIKQEVYIKNYLNNLKTIKNQ